MKVRSIRSPQRFFFSTLFLVQRFRRSPRSHYRFLWISDPPITVHGFYIGHYVTYNVDFDQNSRTRSAGEYIYIGYGIRKYFLDDARTFPLYCSAADAIFRFVYAFRFHLVCAVVRESGIAIPRRFPTDSRHRVRVMRAVFLFFFLTSLRRNPAANE